MIVIKILRRTFKITIWAFLLLFLLPIIIGCFALYDSNWPPNWRSADWGATGIAPDPKIEKRALIQLYSARTGRWKGLLATHNWLVIKSANAKKLTRYEVVGWGTPVRRNAYPVDANWYSNRPEIIYDLRGEKQSD